MVGTSESARTSGPRRWRPHPDARSVARSGTFPPQKTGAPCLQPHCERIRVRRMNQDHRNRNMCSISGNTVARGRDGLRRHCTPIRWKTTAMHGRCRAFALRTRGFAAALHRACARTDGRQTRRGQRPYVGKRGCAPMRHACSSRRKDDALGTRRCEPRPHPHVTRTRLSIPDECGRNDFRLPLSPHGANGAGRRKMARHRVIPAKDPGSRRGLDCDDACATSIIASHRG